MARPALPNEVRLRLRLTDDLPAVSWPRDFTLRSFTADDAPTLHALLVTVFDDGTDGPFEVWWERLRADPEFEPGLCFIACDWTQRLVGAALVWNSSFLKDLAVLPEARRQGLGRALALSAFHALRARGHAHVDLKTHLVANADAVRLYRSLGMVEAPWEG